MTSEELENQLDQVWPSDTIYRQPEYWEDSRFNHASRPVVGVSWYEARAYCAWLSAQTGEAFGLPTEVEWEAAARGSLVGDNVGAGLVPAQTNDNVRAGLVPAQTNDDVGAGLVPAHEGRPQRGRPYAYGNEYDPAKCNTFETHIRATTPVGVFPAGQTPEGIHDLTGNVWEWTTTIYKDYPYTAADGREEAEPADVSARRVVRGGSWGNYQFDARAVSRDRSDPLDRGDVSGFRVVRRRRPPSQ